MGLMVSVVPRVVEQFDNVDQQLPLITRIVIGISAFLGELLVGVAVGIVALALLFWQALKQPAFRLSCRPERCLRRSRARQIAPQSPRRADGTDACQRWYRQPAAVARRSSPYRGDNSQQGPCCRPMTDIVEAVRSGGSLSGAMRASGVFPPLLVYLTASGESAGQLELMLERASLNIWNANSTISPAPRLSLLEPLDYRCYGRGCGGHHFGDIIAYPPTAKSYGTLEMLRILFHLFTDINRACRAISASSGQEPSAMVLRLSK